ncbi:MAG: MmgE/PrpD family protein [Pseudomonadota bacterium]
MGTAEYWREFAGWAAGPVTLPAEASARASRAFLDTAACILAGRGTQAAVSACALDQRVPANRAFAMAAAAHALEFDDYDRPTIGHPSTVLVPAILALGGSRELSGSEALTAYVLGLEAMDRMGEAVNPAHYERGWHATATLGTLGAAVAAARLLGLQHNAMLSAMAIAASAAAGLKGQFGSTGKFLHAGQAARAGMDAVLMAAAGAEGRAKTVSEFARVFGPERPQSPGRFENPLAILQYGLVIKRWPACGYLGRLIPAALELAAETTPDQIASIEIEMPPRNAAVASVLVPGTPDEALFSAPYCVAVCLATGSLTVADFTVDALERPEIVRLMERTTLRTAAHQFSTTDLVAEDPDRLRVTMSEGRVVELLCTELPGSPEAPVSTEMLSAKLQDAAGPGDDVPELLTLLDGLADLPDIAPLTSRLELAHAA